MARYFDPDNVKTGHCHLKRAELGVKRGKGRLCPFSMDGGYDYFVRYYGTSLTSRMIMEMVAIAL